MSAKSIWPSWSEDKLYYIIVIVFLVVLIFFVGSAMSNNVLESDYIGKAPTEAGVINVEGEAKVIGTPDIAVVSIGMVNEADTVSAAQTENTTNMNNLIAEVKKMGIVAADIQTTDYSIYPNYVYDDGRRELTGYTVSQSVEVKIRDLSKISDVLNIAGQSGANQVSGVNFRIDDPAELEAEARREAVADAKQKAEDIAKDLGVRLGDIVSFNESTPQNYRYAEYAADAIGGGGPDIEAGTLDVTSQVNIVYEIK